MHPKRRPLQIRVNMNSSKESLLMSMSIYPSNIKLDKISNIYFERESSLHFLRKEGNKPTITRGPRTQKRGKGSSYFLRKRPKWNYVFKDSILAFPTIKEMERAGCPNLLLIVVDSSFPLFVWHAFFLFPPKKIIKRKQKPWLISL